MRVARRSRGSSEAGCKMRLAGPVCVMLLSQACSAKNASLSVHGTVPLSLLSSPPAHEDDVCLRMSCSMRMTRLRLPWKSCNESTWCATCTECISENASQAGRRKARQCGKNDTRSAFTQGFDHSPCTLNAGGTQNACEHFFFGQQECHRCPNSPGSTPASARSSSCAMAALHGCRKQSARSDISGWRSGACATG